MKLTIEIEDLKLIHKDNAKFLTQNNWVFNKEISKDSQRYIDEIQEIQNEQVTWMTILAKLKEERIKKVITRLNDGEFKNCANFVRATESKGQKAIGLIRELEKEDTAKQTKARITTATP